MSDTEDCQEVPYDPETQPEEIEDTQRENIVNNILQSEDEDLFDGQEEPEEEEDVELSLSGIETICLDDIIAGLHRIPVEGKKTKLWPTPIHFYDFIAATKEKYCDLLPLIYKKTINGQINVKGIYHVFQELNGKPSISSWTKLVQHVKDNGGSTKLFPSEVVSQIRILTEGYQQWKEQKQSSAKLMEELLKAPVKAKKITAKRKITFEDSSGKAKMSRPAGNTKDKLFSSRYMNDQAPTTSTLSTIARTPQEPVNVQSSILDCLNGTRIKSLRNGQEEVIDSLKTSQSIVLYDDRATTTYTHPATLSDICLKIEVMSGGAFLSSAPWKERKWTANIDVFRTNTRMINLINQIQGEIVNAIERDPGNWPATTKLNFRRQ